MIANRESAAQAIGLWVIAALAVLTAIEFAVFLAVDSSQGLVTVLIVIALAKAWLIVSYFMHAARVWQGEEESE
jgi:cytochrome c oxidase subunit IV